jgi:serine/threonine protein kinase
VDEYDTKYLLKLWPFDGETPDQYKHALWDAELRTLYRVGSSPGAEETILIIRDAGLDRAAHCFVMVLEARGPTGYETLAGVFPERSRFPWLSNRDPQARRETWQGLQQLADGLQLLHDQYVLHRNVGPEAVFFSPQLGPSSLRLGGFEWSIRLGLPQTKSPPAGWSSPPEFFTGSAYGYSHETDWYAFGILALRCLLNIEPYANDPPLQRYQRVLRDLEKATARQLSDLERTFLLRLIDADSASRLARAYEVRTAIKDILAALEYGAAPGADTRPLVVVINPATNQDLVDQAQKRGFVPNDAQPKEPFNPLSQLHLANLTTFIQRDLATAQLYAVPGANFYILTGTRLTLMLVQFEYTDKDVNTRAQTWDLSYCPGIGQVRWNEGGSGCVNLPEGVITVRTVRQIHMDRQIRQNARSWERYLPSIDRAIQLRASLARFHEFIRCTNQLELLLRDAEIFRYEVVERDDSEAGLERIIIRESPGRRPVASFCAVEGGLIEFLGREIESKKQDCDLAPNGIRAVFC